MLPASASPNLSLCDCVENQVDTQHFQTSFLSYRILSWFYISNLDSLNCKRAVLENDILYWMVESSCPSDVSDKTGHVSSAWKLSQLSWNFIVKCIVFKNSTDFQFSFFASVIGALFNGIFIIWPTKAKTPIIPHVESCAVNTAVRIFKGSFSASL